MYQHPGIVLQAVELALRQSTQFSFFLFFFKEEVILHDEFNVEHVGFILVIMVNNTASVVFYSMCNLCVHCVKNN